MANVTEADVTLLKQQTAGLSREEKYLLQQYTHHGDIIMNAFMRGLDDFDTYKMNVYNPEMDEGEAHAFFCLFLLELDPTALNDPTHFDGGILKYSGSELLADATFMRYYQYNIYPNFTNKPFQQLIMFFRDMTANVIKKIGAILVKRPPFDKLFLTYRGSNHRYLEATDKALNLGSFHSTSIDRSVADKFGKFVYKYCIYPGCIFMYVEPLTIHHGEKEVLLGPGNRYVAIPSDVRKEIDESDDLFIILPPKFDDAKNKRMINQASKKIIRAAAMGAAAAGGGGGGGAAAGGGGGGGAAAVELFNSKTNEVTVNNILKKLKENIAQNKMYEEFYGAAATKQRRGGTRKYKRKSRRSRRRQTRKQRGGVSIETFNPMNRWAADPIFVSAEELSDDDLEIVAEMLAALKE